MYKICLKIAEFVKRLKKIIKHAAFPAKIVWSAACSYMIF